MLHDTNDIIIMYPPLFTLSIRHYLYALMLLLKHLKNNIENFTASIYYDSKSSQL